MLARAAGVVEEYVKDIKRDGNHRAMKNTVTRSKDATRGSWPYY